MTKQYCPKAMAKLKAIQDHYKNTPKTRLPNTRIGASITPARVNVFGRPEPEVVSPRVQRIRDLQAGKRVAPIERRTMVWHEAPAKTPSINRQAAPAKPAESYDDMVERMTKKMDEAADYMEKK